MSSPVWFSIPEFTGIQQHKDGRLLPIGSAYDARNIDTSDGNLNIAKGFSRYQSATFNVNVSKIPGTETILKLIPSAHTSYDLFVVTRSCVYRHDPALNTWSKARNADDSADFDFGQQIGGPVNTLYTKIGNEDVVLICTGGGTQMFVLNLVTGRVRGFGSGSIMPSVGSASVVSYDASTLTVTVDQNMTSEFKTQALIRGVCFVHDTIILSYVEVAGFPANNKITLAYAPSVSFDVTDEVHVRGQDSLENVTISTMYANRLFAAGAPSVSHGTRLYWSAVPGDGRTIEDWTSVTGSEDASGGYVDVGSDLTDEITSITALSNQLIIWKQRSVWRLFGDRPNNFTLELVGRNFGELSRGAPLVYHDAPYMLTNKGLLTYDNVDIVPVNSDGNHLQRFLAGKDFTYARNAFHNNRMYFCGKKAPYPAEWGTHNNFIVTFDLATGAYMIRDGFEVADLVAFGDDLLLLNKDRYVYKFESGTTYNGAKIHAYWQTQPMDFGRKMYRHQLMGMYMQLTGGDVKINIDGDYAGSSKELVAKKDTTRKGYIAVRVQTDLSNELSFKFDNKTGTNTYTDFAIKGGINIKTLSELKE